MLLLFTAEKALFAQATLMIDPKRIVFENNKRTDDVTLYNSGNDTTSYLISFRHFEMLESGELKRVDSAINGIAFADSLIRIFPRGVRLAPHTSQVVRLQFLKPKGLSPAEYRTHVYVVEADPAKALGAPASDSTDKTIALKIRAIVGLAIPVIIRYQTKPPVISLSNLALSGADTSGNLTVTFQMNRSGDESCYGNLLLSYKEPDGKSILLSENKGTGVYVPLSRRNFTMKFKLPEGIKLNKGGALKLEYRNSSDSQKEMILAMTELPVVK